jgi:hypothetical protein
VRARSGGQLSPRHRRSYCRVGNISDISSPEQRVGRRTGIRFPGHLISLYIDEYNAAGKYAHFAAPPAVSMPSDEAACRASIAMLMRRAT